MPSELAVRGEAPLNLATENIDHGVQRLPEGWLVGWECDIGGPPGHPVRIPLVVLHPAFGVALLGSGKPVEEADEILRRRLTEARFGAIFGGHLPVLNGTIERAELPRLVPILMEAFGRVQLLDLAGGDAWVSTVTRLVVPSDRCWTDNLQGLPPAGIPGRVAPAEADRATWRAAWQGEPAAVMPLRRVAGPQPEAAEPEQRLPLPNPQPIVHRRWPWALCAFASAAAMVLSLEFSYSGDAPVPDAPAASVDAVAFPTAPVAAGAPVNAGDGAMATGADAALPRATSAPAGAAPAAAEPGPVVLPVVPARIGVVPPRVARPPRAEPARHVQAHVQAHPAKAKAIPVVKPASTSRREPLKRGRVSG